MNWWLGFKRLWYAALGLFWVFIIFKNFSGGPFEIGQAIGGLMIFSLAWVALGWLIAWVVRGFLSARR